jgi:hypothetical protein
MVYYVTLIESGADYCEIDHRDCNLDHVDAGVVVVDDYQQHLLLMTHVTLRKARGNLWTRGQWFCHHSVKLCDHELLVDNLSMMILCQ